MTAFCFDRLNKSPYVYLIIFISVFVTYFRSLENGYIWDDEAYPLKAEVFYSQGAEGLKRIWFDLESNDQFYPLTHTSYFIEHYFWGSKPFGYHLVNVLLHAGVAIMLWQVLLLLKLPCALAISLIFALHPVQVESVAWITERKNVLSGFFYMISMWCFLKWYLQENGKKDYFFYGGALLCFCLALFAKTVTCTLPAVLIVLMLWKKDFANKPLKKSLLSTLPLFIVLVFIVQQTITIEQDHSGAIGIDWDFSLVDRFLIAGRAIVFYIGKLIWPQDIIFFYPRWVIDSSSVVQYIFPAIVLLTIYVLSTLRKDYGSGLLVAFLIFCGTLFPALGFFNVYPQQFSFVADHFQYLASIAMIALIVNVCWSLLLRCGENGVKVAPYLVVLVLAIFALQSQGLQSQYKDEKTLWQATITKNPTAFLPYNNLGVMAYEKGFGDLDAAEALLKKSLVAKPTYIMALNNLAQLYVRRFELTREKQYLNEAMGLIKKAMGVHAQDVVYIKSKKNDVWFSAEYASTHRLYGEITLAMGQRAQAKKIFEKLVKQIPNDWRSLNNLAAMYLKDKNKDEFVIKMLKKSLALNPQQSDAFTLMGTTYYRMKQLDQAMRYLTEAAKRNPSLYTIYFYLAKCYKAKGDFARARQGFENVKRLAPQSPIVNEVNKELASISSKP